MGSCREGRLLLLADHVALIGALAGENFVIEILLPVDIGHTVLQLPDGAAQLLLLPGQHLLALGDR